MGSARTYMGRLKKIFNLAKVPNGHAHRFRDTFAVELLLAGVPLERVRPEPVTNGSGFEFTAEAQRTHRSQPQAGPGSKPGRRREVLFSAVKPLVSLRPEAWLASGASTGGGTVRADPNQLQSRRMWPAQGQYSPQCRRPCRSSCW